MLTESVSTRLAGRWAGEDPRQQEAGRHKVCARKVREGGSGGASGVGVQDLPGPPEAPPGSPRSEEPAPIIGLDVANRAIVEALQRDGRRSYAEIAKQVGLSEAAVRRRVQQLRDNGVLQIVAVTNPLELGFKRQALIGIRVEGDVRDVAAKIVPLPEVDYVVMCAGSFDLLVELVCEDDDGLLHVLNDSIRSIPGVRVTETFVYLNLAKQTYTWGTR